MKFYDALRLLLTGEDVHIGRRGWGVGLKWIKKGTYTYQPDEDSEAETRNTIYIVCQLGANEEQTMYHANPVDMLAEDWYIL